MRKKRNEKNREGTRDFIRVSSLTKDFGYNYEIRRVLDNVSLEVQEGEFLAIMGESGSGKSTLLRLMGGIICPTGGEVTVDDVNLFQLNEDERTEYRRSNIGFIFQDYNLLPFLNGMDNIMLPAKLDGAADDGDYLNELVRELGIEEQLFQRAETLSGGQQQRTAIARAFYSRPKIILADEPTGNLDIKNGMQVMELFGQLRRRYEQTVVMVTHDRRMAEQADRILWIRDGKLTDER